MEADDRNDDLKAALAPVHETLGRHSQTLDQHSEKFEHLADAQLRLENGQQQMAVLLEKHTEQLQHMSAENSRQLQHLADAQLRLENGQQQMGVVLENVQSHQTQLAEVILMTDGITRTFEERCERIEQRLGRIEDAITHHSRGIRTLQADVNLARVDVQWLRAKSVEETERKTALELRVERVEKKVQDKD